MTCKVCEKIWKAILFFIYLIWKANLCLFNFILLGRFILRDKHLATVNQYHLTLFDLPVTSQVKIIKSTCLYTVQFDEIFPTPFDFFR